MTQFNFNNPVIDTSDEDDVHFERSLLQERRRMPYTFKPDHTLGDSAEQMGNGSEQELPGSFPFTEESVPLRESFRSNSPKEEQEDPKVKEPAGSGDKSFEQDHRVCRLCLASPMESPELGRLISPCKCRGTSRWIHLSCLNEWRNRSTNSKSFYRCDQCTYEYRFARVDAARFLERKEVLLALTFMCFTVAMFFGGFLSKFLLWLWPKESWLYSHETSWFSGFFYTPLDGASDLVTAASTLIPSAPSTFRDIFKIDVWHWFQGFLSLGVVGVITFLGTGGMFGLRTFHPRRRREATDGRGDLVTYALLFMLIFGAGKVAWAMWKGVRTWSRHQLFKMSDRILEVNPDDD